jgi:hypothetical protein
MRLSGIPEMTGWKAYPTGEIDLTELDWPRGTGFTACHLLPVVQWS